MTAQSILEVILRLPALLLGIGLHEFAHAWAATRLGDSTPREQGRLSLNPLDHLDPLGTLCIIVAPFGWGKPVQFNPYAFRTPVRDTGLVALAGPMTNFLIAATTLLVMVLAWGAVPTDAPTSVFQWLPSGPSWQQNLAELLRNVAVINLALGVFNLLPLPPLDGSKVLRAVAPARLASLLDTAAASGLGTVLFILLLVSGYLDVVFLPVAVLLMLVLHGGLIPAVLFALGAWAAGGLMWHTLPRGAGDSRARPSMAASLRLLASIGALLLGLALTGWGLWGLYRCASRPERLQTYRATWNQARAVVVARSEGDSRGPARLVVEFEGDRGVERGLVLGSRGPERYAEGDRVELLFERDASGTIETAIIPDLYLDDVPWTLAGVGTGLGLGFLLGAWLLWPGLARLRRGPAGSAPLSPLEMYHLTSGDGPDASS